MVSQWNIFTHIIAQVALKQFEIHLTMLGDFDDKFKILVTKSLQPTPGSK